MIREGRFVTPAKLRVAFVPKSFIMFSHTCTSTWSIRRSYSYMNECARILALARGIHVRCLGIKNGAREQRLANRSARTLR